VGGAAASDSIVIGTIGRMEAVKDQATLARAFAMLVPQVSNGRRRLRLIMVGDGVLRSTAQKILDEAGCSDMAWLPGLRNDVPELLQAMDIFVLPSLVEGISNTILEAMSCGLPVVATRVGGNEELVVEGETGYLVPSGDPRAMVEAIRRYVDDPGLRKRHASNARARVEREFGIDDMVGRYAALYDDLLRSKGYSPRHASRDSTGPHIA
jgi:glycosyltransferase involved in cell wall biosynthesis